MRMRAVQQLRLFPDSDKALPECFRLLTNEVGARNRILKTVKDFVDLKTPVAQLRKFLQRTAILQYMRVSKNSSGMLTYQSVPSACALYDLRITGEVRLSPQRFTMDYLIDRLQGSAFKVMPYELSAKLPNGDKKKLLKSSGKLKWFVAVDEPTLRIELARSDKFLHLRYVVKVNTIVPAYQRFDVALRGLWRPTISGVFA